MITIEASNIYFGGGYTLLKELLTNLDSRAIATRVYVGYSTIYDELSQAKYSNISFVRTGAMQTLLRYLCKGCNTLFFCSLPPFVKYHNSIVYAHNPHILSRSKFTLFNLKFIVYHYWIRLFKNEVDFFACQTKSVADKLEKIGCTTKLMPFYTQLTRHEMPRIYDFSYISTVAPHKNHDRLLDAIELLVDKGQKFNFVLTVRNDEANANLIKRIERINRKSDIEIVINRGFVGKDEVERIYCSTKTLVFPSLKESFGLPLIEAMQCGLRVIASDRAFTHDVIENPVVFDSEDVQSIASAMLEDLKGKNDTINQILRVEQKIDELIVYLNKKEQI